MNIVARGIMRHELKNIVAVREVAPKAIGKKDMYEMKVPII